MESKWNLKRSQVIVEPDPENPGLFIVTNGCTLIPTGYRLSLRFLFDNFDPADCESQAIKEPRYDDVFYEGLDQLDGVEKE